VQNKRNFITMIPDFSKEIKFKTARSGGKGGQNVNKVETMVEGYWNFMESTLFDDAEKALIETKLANKINSDGLLLVKSQTARTQLGNKGEVVEKMHDIVQKALVVQAKRKPTKIPKAVVRKRLENKKKNAEIKQGRQKISKYD
jgi:ribosome-associated protein